LLASYGFKKVFYISAEGQVMFETLDIQLVNDVQVQKFNCQVGDSIKAGDTLFSYIDERKLDEQRISSDVHNNITQTNWEEKEKLHLEEQISLKQIEKTRQQQLLKEAKIEKDRVQKEVYLDVYTADKLNPYIRQINDLTSTIKSLDEEIEVLKENRKKLSSLPKDSIGSVNIQLQGTGSDKPELPIEYFISPIDGVVSHVFKKDFETVLESEHVMALHIPKKKVYIKAFFEQSDIKHMHIDDVVEVKFANGYTTKGKINRFYFDTYELPIHFKKSNEDFQGDIETDIVPVNESEMEIWRTCQKLEVKVNKQRYF
jgi:multidrug resistance efflux pump